MRFEVRLETNVPVADGIGGFRVLWQPTATIRCDIQPLSMSERLQADRMVTDATHRVTMRYRDLSPTTQRLVFGSRIWNITSVINPDQSNNHLIVLVREE